MVNFNSVVKKLIASISAEKEEFAKMSWKKKISFTKRSLHKKIKKSANIKHFGTFAPIKPFSW